MKYEQFKIMSGINISEIGVFGAAATVKEQAIKFINEHSPQIKNPIITENCIPIEKGSQFIITVTVWWKE